MNKEKPPGSALPPIEDRLSFLIHRINAQLARICNPFFGTLDMDLYSSRIMVILLEKGAVRVGELVDLMALPQSTISHQLQRLEKRGLLTRSRVSSDNRSVTVKLTKEGNRAAQQCNVTSAIVYDAMIKDMSADDMEILRDHMSAMFERLKNFDGEQVLRSQPAATKPAGGRAKAQQPWPSRRKVRGG